MYKIKGGYLIMYSENESIDFTFFLLDPSLENKLAFENMVFTRSKESFFYHLVNQKKITNEDFVYESILKEIVISKKEDGFYIYLPFASVDFNNFLSKQRFNSLEDCFSYVSEIEYDLTKNYKWVFHVDDYYLFDFLSYFYIIYEVFVTDKGYLTLSDNSENHDSNNFIGYLVVDVNDVPHINMDVNKYVECLIEGYKLKK